MSTSMARPTVHDGPVKTGAGSPCTVPAVPLGPAAGVRAMDDPSAAPVRSPAPKGPPPIVNQDTLGLAGLAGQLARDRHLLILPLARAASTFCARQGWKHLGYANPDDFARQFLDRTARWLQDLSSLGRCFEKLPDLARGATGLDEGSPLGQGAALLVGRVATNRTVGDWIDRARRLSLKELGAAVREQRKGARSVLDDAPELEPKRGVRLHAPAEVRLAWDETLDLHRAVAAREGSIASFVDALNGESIATGVDLEGFDLDPGPPDTQASAGTDTASSKPRSSEAPRAQVRPHPVRWGKHGRPILERQLRGAPAPDRKERSGAPPLVPAVRRARKTLQRMGQIILRLDRIQDRIQSPGWERENPTPGLTRLVRSRDIVASAYVLRNLVRVQDEIDMRIADLLLELTQRRDWESLGYQNLEQFAGEKLRMGRTRARGRVALARGFGRLHLVREAYETGSLHLSAATWVVRAFRRWGNTQVPAAEQRAWIDHARTTTVKCLREKERLLEREHLVARADVARIVSIQFYKRQEKAKTRTEPVRGSVESLADPVACGAPTPSSQTSGGPKGAGVEAPDTPRRSGAGVELFRRHMADRDASNGKGSKVAPSPIGSRSRSSFSIPDDDAWRESILRVPGRSIVRVLELENDVLQRVVHKWALAPVSWTVLLPRETGVLFRACMKATRTALVERTLSSEDMSPADDARLRPSERLARAFVQRRHPVPDWLGLLAMLEDFVLTWDESRPQRMTLERIVACRDGWRCTAPGCTSRRGEAHHIVFRSNQGADEPWNLTFLCPFHHRQGIHGILARCQGAAPSNLLWRLGPSDHATWFHNETLLPPAEATSSVHGGGDSFPARSPIEMAIRFFDAPADPVWRA